MLFFTDILYAFFQHIFVVKKIIVFEL